MLDEWNALDNFVLVYERGERRRKGKGKRNLGESLKKGQLTLLTREETKSQGFYKSC